MLKAEVNNMPKNPRKYVVAKVVENELWYWMTFDNKFDAERSASEYAEAIVLEMVD